MGRGYHGVGTKNEKKKKKKIKLFQFKKQEKKEWHLGTRIVGYLPVWFELIIKPMENYETNMLLETNYQVFNKQVQRRSNNLFSFFLMLVPNNLFSFLLFWYPFRRTIHEVSVQVDHNNFLCVNAFIPLSLVHLYNLCVYNSHSILTHAICTLPIYEYYL